MTSQNQLNEQQKIPLILVKGAGEQASGIAARCIWAGLRVVMTEIDQPLAIRRTVAFSEAAFDGETVVEGITCIRANDPQTALSITDSGRIALLIDPNAAQAEQLTPTCVIDAIMAKRNTGTHRQPDRLTIGIGPGFTAGEDVDAVIETNRSHYLGRVYYRGSAQEDTGVPGDIIGAHADRVAHASRSGIFTTQKSIGDHVDPGAVIGWLDGEPIIAAIGGVLRGLMRSGQNVNPRTKLADIDPRDRPEYCRYISDKALAIGGGALQAIFQYVLSLKLGGKP